MPTKTIRQRISLRKLQKSLARHLGIRAHNPNLIWFEDEAFLALMRRFDPNYKRIRERPYGLYHLARSVASLPGDTAECGVFRGAGSHIIRSATESPERHHYLFDSFEGLSKLETQDRQSSSAVREWQEGDFAVDLETVQSNLSQHSNLVFCMGWIPDRFAEVEDRTFALVHIDVDLYQPTLDSLQFFYPRLVPGGLAISDDYGLSTCPGAYQAMNQYADEVGAPVVHLPTGQGILFKR